MFKFYLKVKLKFMLKSSDIQSLKSNFEVKSYKKDEVIFPQGQIADGAYIVIKGLVHLKKEHKNANIVQHLGKIGPGDSFGAWYVLFESELRQVTALALADSELIFIPNKVLHEKLKSCDPFIIYCFRKWLDLIENKKVPVARSSLEKNRKNDPDFSKYEA